MNPGALSLRGIRKRFAKHRRLREIVLHPLSAGYEEALRGIDIELGGGIAAILGPNGAGKSTLLRIVAGLVAADGGEVLIAGRPAEEYGQKLNEKVTLVIGEERSFYYQLTARQNLEFFAAMGGLFGSRAGSEIDRVLDLVDLLPEAEKPFADMSSGMKQRLALARGLLTNPDILMFDEITKGLDPGHAARFRQLVRKTLTGDLGKTIVFATHNMEEARELADTVIVMDRGLIAAAGPYGDVLPRLEQVFGIGGAPA
jgi:ABC-2 type transport system ATP-binding protein